MFATQLITDNLKGDNASTEEKAVQDLFDLATYRFIGKQTATCIPVLESKFPGMYTETELYRIPSLDMGSFMVTAGDQNLEVKFLSQKRKIICLPEDGKWITKSIVEDSEMGRIFFYFYVVFSTNYYCASDRWHGNGFVWKIFKIV